MAAKKKEAQLPTKFVPIQSEMAGFFKLEQGNKVIGIIRDRIETKSGKFGPKAFYKLEITDGMCLVLNKKEEVEAGEGETIGIDEKGWLKSLKNVDVGTEVYIECLGIGTAEKGQNAPWKFLTGRVPQE